MSVIYLLIPLSIILVGVAVWALIWAVRSGQFDDLESQGWNVVLDDDTKPPPHDGKSDGKSDGKWDAEAEHEAGDQEGDKQGGDRQ